MYQYQLFVTNNHTQEQSLVASFEVESNLFIAMAALQKVAPKHLVYDYPSPHPISWLYNFSEGGWNSVQATSKGEAIRLAQEKSNLALDILSFRPSTTQDVQALMSSFD